MLVLQYDLLQGIIICLGYDIRLYAVFDLLCVHAESKGADCLLDLTHGWIDIQHDCCSGVTS